MPIYRVIHRRTGEEQEVETNTPAHAVEMTGWPWTEVTIKLVPIEEQIEIIYGGSDYAPETKV